MTHAELQDDIQKSLAEFQATNKESAPTRAVILDRIANELAMLNQYRDNLNQSTSVHDAGQIAGYAHRAEALIELLEIHDCGSVGGFDPEVTNGHGLHYLEERFDALKRKFNPRNQ